MNTSVHPTASNLQRLAIFLLAFLPFSKTLSVKMAASSSHKFVTNKMCPFAQKAWIALEGMIRYGGFLVLVCFYFEYVTRKNFFTPGNMNASHDKFCILLNQLILPLFLYTHLYGLVNPCFTNSFKNSIYPRGSILVWWRG